MPARRCRKGCGGTQRPARPLRVRDIGIRVGTMWCPAPDRGEGEIDSLPMAVQNILEDLIDDKKLERKDVDQRLVRALSKLSEDNAEEALKRFSESLDGTIRSKQGFLIGIVKRLNPDSRGRGRGRGGDRYGGGDRY